MENVNEQLYIEEMREKKNEIVDLIRKMRDELLKKENVDVSDYINRYTMNKIEELESEFEDLEARVLSERASKLSEEE